MLSPSELKNYASLRGVSVRDIEAYCDLSAGHISNIFNGERSMTEEIHMKIANGINAAYTAKLNGTFTRPPLDKNKNAIKPEKQSNNGEPAAPTRSRKRTASK